MHKLTNGVIRYGRRTDTKCRKLRLLNDLYLTTIVRDIRAEWCYKLYGNNKK